MCGIMGYVGKQKASQIILDGLKRLEYRGYDSAGIATISAGLTIKKDQGAIDTIEAELKLSDMPGTIGIGHTRWATHGEPSMSNAHPHTDCEGKIAVVHNGIIENYREIQKFLMSHGCEFCSETDTEVIPHFISYYMRQKLSLEEAVKKAVLRLKGSFALAIISTSDPKKLIAVRKNSPLIIGLGTGENFVASDIPAVLDHTRRSIIMQDGEIAILTQAGVKILNYRAGMPVTRAPTEIKWSIDMAEKGGYPHFMLKEIHEQPSALRNTLRAPVEELDKVAKMLLDAKHVYLVACGTAYHASLVFKYALAKLANISAEAVVSSEFQESCIPGKDTVVMTITQSGETADTLKAVGIAKDAGAKVACLTNVVGSSITRASDISVLTHAGPEIGVAATKTFTSQVVYLLALAYRAAYLQGNLTGDDYKAQVAELHTIPEIVKTIIGNVEPQIKDLAGRYKDIHNFYFIGRGIGYPTVLEGALKLKEISYIHSEAYPAGELKHGPLALIERDTPVVAIVTPGPSRNRMIGNIEEAKARGASVIAVAQEDDDDVDAHAAELIHIPSVPEMLTPIAFIVPLQLLSYYIGVERGFNPDKPRNLAKSVTVE